MPYSQKLTELKEFKWALWGPLGAAVIVAIIITVADYLSPESLQFCLTSECINDAINRHKLSLGIAALVFPLVALVASNHRSVQTAKQIKEAEFKNNFENHIKHKEIFKDALITSAIELNNYVDEPNKLYKLVFSNNDENHFSPYLSDKNLEVSFIEFIKEFFIKSMELSESRSVEGYLEYLNLYFEIEAKIQTFNNDKVIQVYDEILNNQETAPKVFSLYKLYEFLIDFSLSDEDKKNFEIDNVEFFKSINGFCKIKNETEIKLYINENTMVSRESNETFNNAIVEVYNKKEFKIEKIDSSMKMLDGL